MRTQTLSVVWNGGGETLTQDVVMTADGEKNSDIDLPVGLTNQLVNMTFQITGLVFLEMLSDINCTVKTNSSATPQETISLTANNPLVYRAGDGRGAVFAGNVTALYITNPGSAAGTLRIRALQDVTP